MNKEKNFSVRRFNFSDIDGIIKLLNIVFKPNFSREWWKWKYELNPNGFWGEKGDIWIAEKDGEIIGHYAIIPEKVKFHSKVINAAQSVDTVTHPDYRGLGIFPTLANKVYSEARNRYSLIFGFPSKMAYNGFIRLGWKDLFSISEYNRILNYDQLCKRKFTRNFTRWFGKIFLKMYSNSNRISSFFSPRKIKGSNVEIQKIEKFSDEINIFWERVRLNYKIILERTDIFLNWRFSKYFGDYQIFVGRSTQKNDLIGYMVLRKRENTLDIIDLVTLPAEDKALLQLIDLAIKIGKNEDVDSIHCWFPSWDKNIMHLKKMGFISIKQLLRLAGEHGNPFILYNLTSEELPGIKECFYTLADTDYA
jgi:GNAT superfamily N-acetyltransferase